MGNVARKPEFFNTSLALPPSDHARILHPSPKGRAGATLAWVGEKWSERFIPLQDLPSYAASLAGTKDAYLSQQAFYGWRRISKLANLGACYVDLDFYNTDYARFSPDILAVEVLRHIDDLTIPYPSYVLSTGRGLVVVWLLEQTNRRACPRWMAVQRQLFQALTSFGADRAALDAARVFRLSGSVNSKSSTVVRPVWMSSPSDPVRYDFDTFADEILPKSRAEIRVLQDERERKRKAAQEKAATKLVSPNGLTQGTLWATRLDDLQKLLQLRWFGTLPEGQRDHWLFLAINAMSWLAPPAALRRESFALAKEVGGWNEREAQERMRAIFNRAESAAKGETIEWRGQQIDPRYRFKTETMIQWLSITEEEMRTAGLRSIVSDTVRRELDRERKRQERGSDQKRQERAKRDWEILKMATAGYPQTEIAAAFGVSRRHVGRVIDEAKNRKNP